MPESFPGPRAGFAVVAALAMAAAMLAACGGDATSSARAIERGRAIYAQHCAACHGAKLEGQPDWRTRRPDGKLPAPPHDASGHTWHHDPETLFRIVKQGIAALAGPGYQTDMPAYAGVLSDEEIRAVLAYIRSTWPESVQARQPKGPR